MRKEISIFVIAMCMPFATMASELSGAIMNVRDACGGISGALNNMKTLAGINTAVTGVGTVAGGVALGTGIAKASVDKKISEYEEAIAQLEASGAQEITDESMLYDVLSGVLRETGDPEYILLANKLQEKKKEAEVKSKTLGNIRTGTMAGAAVTNIAGAVIAGNNRVKGDLQSQINECIDATRVLSNVKMQERLNGNADAKELERADKIVSSCSAWETVDLSKIDNRAKGAMVSSTIGATTGVAGTVTSASANSDKVRNDNSESGVKREKNLNTASNILAGTTTVASGVATVFNATQIRAIKRAATVADECEGAIE